jgi:serine/threonine protein kinase
VYLTRGDLAKYKAELHLLHEIDGENHDYLTDLAKCVIDNDLIDQTMREGNRALNTKILKQLIKRKAHDDTAVALFERLSRLEPDNAILRGALAKAYELRGQPDKELEHLLVLSALKPDIEEIAKRTASLAIQNNLLEPVLLTAQGKVLSLVAREIANRKLEGPICSRIVEKAAKESQKDQLIEEPMAATPKAPEPAPPLPMEPPPSRVAPSETPPASVTQRVRQAAAEKRAKTTGTIKVKISPASAEKKMEAPLGKAPYPISAPEPGAQEAPLVLQKGAPEIAPVEPSIDVTEPKASPRVEPPVTTFVSAHSKEEPLIELGGQQMVQITVAHDAPSASVDPITTFVSGHAKGRAAVQYREEELYRPHAGGLAFTAVQGLARDGWGAWQTAAEINSGRDVLLRVFDKGLMKAVVLEDEVMEEFVQQISHLAATMAHKNVLEVEEVVTGPGRLRGLIYSYLPHTLEQVLSPGERPQLDSLLELIREIVDGLAYASNYKGLDGIYRKICHLNMQASQILVGDDLKTCKIAGFGYSEVFRKLIRAKGPRWQDPGMNPAYLPPEFFRAKEVGIDERAANVYSLGVLMHFIATGEPPFEGPAFDDYKFQHTKIIPAPTRLINPAVPDWLEEVILTSLEKDPEKRWSSVAEIQEVLKREMR